MIIIILVMAISAMLANTRLREESTRFFRIHVPEGSSKGYFRRHYDSYSDQIMKNLKAGLNVDLTASQEVIVS